MATFTARAGIDTRTLRLGDLEEGTVTIASPTHVRVSYDAASYSEVYGAFANPTTAPSGTINLYVEVENGAEYFRVEGMSYDFGRFSALVEANDTATFKREAFGGSDTFIGSAGNDYIEYHGGNDTYELGAGTDTVGITTGDAVGVTVPVSSGVFDLYIGSGTLRLNGVEAIQFSSGTVAPGNLAFDPAAYLAANADLAAAFRNDTAAGARHYVLSGRTEGRATSGFDASGYLAANPDLAAAFGTDVTLARAHWLANGAAEGRPTRFDTFGYLASNPDLLAAFGSNLSAAVNHYLTNGRTEGRGTTAFNGANYLLANPDVAAAGFTAATAARHYVSNGFAEGRRTAPASLAIA